VMALIVRSKYIKPNKPPCHKECKERQVGCQSKCEKYIEWKKAYNDRKIALKKHIRSVANIEEFEIIQRQKIKKKNKR
jgi:hypothetical protein